MKLPSKEPKPLETGIYKTDYLNLRPLFQAYPSKKHYDNEEGYILKSWEEAYGMHEDAQIKDVNPAYIASILFNNHSTNISPYQRIKRIPRSCFVQLSKNNNIKLKSYNPFLKTNNEYINEQEIYLNIRNTFLNNLKNNLKNVDGNLGCEHSSGIDSNAIVGSLVLGLNIKKDRIFTWTSPQGENLKLIEDIRDFYKLFSKNCLKKDIKNNKNEDKNLLKIFGAPLQVGANLAGLKSLKEANCELIFSGLGGDQALSNMGNNVGIDLFEKGNFSELLKWTGSKKDALKIIFKKNINDYWFKRFKNFQKFLKYPRNSQSYYVKKFLTNEGFEYLQNYIPASDNLERYNNLKVQESIRKSLNSNWLSLRVEEEKRLAEYYGMKKLYPMLDENIISLLLSIENTKIFATNSKELRSLIREVFKPYLNEFFIRNPQKHIGKDDIENRRIILKNILNESHKSISRWHNLIHKWFDLNLLTSNIESLLKNNEDFNYLNNVCWLINKIDKINHWLIELEK